MKSDDRPRSCSGLHRRPAVGRGSHRWGAPTAAVINPSRMKKKLEEVVQKLDRTSAGKNEALYAANAPTSPAAANPRFTRRSASAFRAASRTTPATAPAVTN